MKFLCRICGEELFERKDTIACSFCGLEEETDWLCSSNHYQCESCRLASPKEIILRVCESSKSIDPVALVKMIMLHPSFNCHGIEHHILPFPIILTTLRNSGLFCISKRRLEVGIKRIEDIPYGVCGTRGACGACTVIMNKQAVKSYLIRAKKLNGAEILTIEGITNEFSLHPIQEAFVKTTTVQYGFCTPGYIMELFTLFQENINVSEEEVHSALEPHLCRCTGYKPILDAAFLSQKMLKKFHI